jgi:hypothetical protein
MGDLPLPVAACTQVFASVEVPLEAATDNFQVTVGMNFFFQ